MKLYYRSNVAIEKSRLLQSDRRFDFGPGPYCTSSDGQAARQAAVGMAITHGRVADKVATGQEVR